MMPEICIKVLVNDVDIAAMPLPISFISVSKSIIFHLQRWNSGAALNQKENGLICDTA